MAESKSIEVQIVRKNPNGVSPIYANDMIAVHSDREIFITFSILEPPVAADESEFERLKEVHANAVVKLVLEPKFAETVIKVLGEIVKKHHERAEK